MVSSPSVSLGNRARNTEWLAARPEVHQNGSRYLERFGPTARDWDSVPMSGASAAAPKSGRIERCAGIHVVHQEIAQIAVRISAPTQIEHLELDRYDRGVRGRPPKSKPKNVRAELLSVPSRRPSAPASGWDTSLV